MGLAHAGRQAVGVHGKAMVHRDDLDLAGLEVLDRMVGPVMPLRHLQRASAHRQRQHLMAQADAKGRHAGLQHAPDGIGGIGARGRGRVAGPVRDQHPVRAAGQHLVGGRGGRHDGGACADIPKCAQDVALDAIVQDHDLEARVGDGHKALAAPPAPFGHLIGLGGGHVPCQVQPLQAAPGACLGHQRPGVGDAGRIMGDHGVLHPLLADQYGQCPRVDARESDNAACRQPVRQRLARAPVRRHARDLAEHGPPRRHRGGRRGRFAILVIGADIADMGKGEGHDLGGVGRVGQDLLIAGDGGVEAHLAHRRADRADPFAQQHGAVRQRERAGRAPRGGRRAERKGGHGGTSGETLRSARGRG